MREIRVRKLQAASKYAVPEQRTSGYFEKVKLFFSRQNFLQLVENDALSFYRKQVVVSTDCESIQCSYPREVVSKMQAMKQDLTARPKCVVFRLDPHYRDWYSG